MEDMIVLWDDTWSEGRALDSFFDSLGDIKRCDTIRQAPNGLIIASTKRPLHIVFLSIGVFIEHRGQVGHLVMPDGLPTFFHRLLQRIVIR